MWGWFNRPNFKAILKGVGVKDAEACLVWAFGEGYGSKPICSMDDIWNKRHGEIFTMYGSDRVIDAIELVGKVYKERYE